MSAKMNTQVYFATHPVFTVEEFDRLLHSGAGTPKNNRRRLLAHHTGRGRLAPIRRGIYAVIPIGAEAANYPVDSYLIAGRLRPDAVITYHSALAFHGVAHSAREERVILTRYPLQRPFRFQGVEYRTVRPPKALVAKRREDVGIDQAERQNQSIRVTSLERTLVDCLDRPRLGGGWEEVWRSFEAVPYLDVDAVVGYALLLENATTIAAVGYFLELKQEPWMVGNDHLEWLRAHRPKRPHYLGRMREEPGRLIKNWNVMVPERIVDRAWEETGEPIA